MNRLEKIIRRLKMARIIRPIIWAAILIGSSFVFRGYENSGLILNFLISGAVIDILYLSKSATVKHNCSKQKVG